MYFHLIWDYPVIQDFWRAVVADINAVTNLSVTMDPKLLLLSIFDLVIQSTHRKGTPTKLEKLAAPPTVAQWNMLVDSVLTLI